MIATLPHTSSKRVLAVGPMPPEKLAYALARYSRSPDSIKDSIEWVRAHDSAKFLESFYFQYGHASIADLGHITICFEGVSEIAAAELEDEQLWDGQARSSRYQDFSKSGVVVPPELTSDEEAIYTQACDKLLEGYREVKERAAAYLQEQLPKPEDMRPDAYARNIAARAFDVARYLLPFGIPTGVGQVTSIRTLEKQIRRLKGSEFGELRELGDELSAACATPAACVWQRDGNAEDPIAPTLARHAEPDEFPRRLRADLSEWAAHHLPQAEGKEPGAADLVQPTDHIADICASLLYPVTDRPFRELYGWACSWPTARRQEVLGVALGSRERWDELPRQFRSAPYVFDFVMDIGAYRDLHRHRRCQQLRQQYTNKLGYEVPEIAKQCGADRAFAQALQVADDTIGKLPHPAAQYALPLAAKSRFLFKMDFAELEYISRLRSGVKGHFAYRRIAWEMKKALEQADPILGALVDATPPWIEDPLKR
ncbi:MAG: FAD-dependent thymidylate synthase [Acidobacteriaceae bacterium]|nr:FAD-dependent thymidylate synthase [Acidobacteriaceae bacterium]